MADLHRPHGDGREPEEITARGDLLSQYLDEDALHVELVLAFLSGSLQATALR
ncbi:hypothetical protein [Amycolatopsis saalfeldensis]|uniref:hypothetical protein n=1 Tax=Amycolatopsis saalfeldensis TaxID=394193 RepID=UPI0015A70122|nr:hypothetical protein [Amycolatopsis saalfeldensis]